MYTTFGWIDNSPSMFIGNGASLILSIVQLGQKVHYKRLKNNPGLSRLNGISINDDDPLINPDIEN
jgi:hypothetical protein